MKLQKQNLHKPTKVAVIGRQRRVVQTPVLQIIVTSIGVPENSKYHNDTGTAPQMISNSPLFDGQIACNIHLIY